MAHTLNSNNDVPTKTEPKDFPEDDCKFVNSLSCLLCFPCSCSLPAKQYADESGRQQRGEHSRRPFPNQPSGRNLCLPAPDRVCGNFKQTLGSCLLDHAASLRHNLGRVEANVQNKTHCQFDSLARTLLEESY